MPNSPSMPQRRFPPPGVPNLRPSPPQGAFKQQQKPTAQCSIPGCGEEVKVTELRVGYCQDHLRRYELFVMGILPEGGATLVEQLFAMFDYLVGEIDKLNTSVEMQRVRKKYLGDKDGDVGPDTSDARHRYTRKSDASGRRFKGVRKR